MVAELILLLTKHHISCWWDGIEIARNKIITKPDQGFTWYVGWCTVIWSHCSSPYPSASWQCPGMGRLQHRFHRLRLLATCSITITNKQNHIVIDYDYTVSNHDYNRDYICLDTPSEREEHKTDAAHFRVATQASLPFS